MKSLVFEQYIKENGSLGNVLSAEDVLRLEAGVETYDMGKVKMYTKLKEQVNTLGLYFGRGMCEIDDIKNEVSQFRKQIWNENIIVILDYLQKVEAPGNTTKEKVDTVMSGLCGIRDQHKV